MAPVSSVFAAGFPGLAPDFLPLLCEDILNDFLAAGRSGQRDAVPAQGRVLQAEIDSGGIDASAQLLGAPALHDEISHAARPGVEHCPDRLTLVDTDFDEVIAGPEGAGFEKRRGVELPDVAAQPERSISRREVDAKLTGGAA